MKVLMLPQLEHFRSEESGIKRVVEAYHRYGPDFGIEFVKEGEPYNVKVSHAGTNTENIDVAMLHGLYFTADYPASAWEWRANANVIDAARQARVITVPSQWVAETIIRDMRRVPTVIGHGIDTEDWDHKDSLGDYVLWNKNRIGDVCDPAPVGLLAQAYPSRRFITTFAPKQKRQNMTVTGVVPHEQMKRILQGAACYLATTKETFGIGTLEAMAAGVPILGYAHGGNLELVKHGVNGYLAEPGNEQDLIEGLAYCLKYGKDLGANGREVVKAFSWPKVMEKVVRVFRSGAQEESPTVAIIIPSYNYGDKVSRAIQSAMQQTYTLVKEIIVVDDGSTDNTEDVVREWMQKDARVVYLPQENSGVAVARNTGIAHASTTYVCCLDADDAIEPEFIEECVAALEEDHRLGLAYTKIRHVLPNGKTGVSPWPGEWDFDDQLVRKNQVPTCNVFRRDVWKALGGYKSRYCPKGAGSEDAEFWTRIGAYGWSCKLATPKPLFIYSLGSGRVSGNPEGYQEVDWLAWHPWVTDKQHPFASYAKPKRWAHPVRQYDEPLVSVIIPVGPGHEKIVEDALDSVEAQTLRQWECIVVWDREDAPPERYLNAYPFVKWIVEGSRKGPGYARNRGAEEARAPFLLFLDADDRLYFHALERFIDEWESEEAIIYSDYVGKAFIEDPSDLAPNLQENIQWREEDGLTVIGYQTPEYDCVRAQRQPDGDPRRVYTWNLITSLIPKAWHEQINGFDEEIESWEDVDYWWRLAKAGKCFRRVAEPLVVYHFYTGQRRDLGLEKHQELFRYLLKKHEQEEVTMCRGCGGRTKPTPTISRTKPAVSAPPLALKDEQFKLCVYNHPSLGQQTTIGQALFRDRVEGVHMVRDRNNQGWRIHYGWRGRGDKFLVHIEDMRLAPHLFTEVEARPTIPKTEKQPLKAPLPMNGDESEEMERTAPQEIDLDAVLAVSVIVEDDGDRENRPFDLQTLPGVTSKIAQKLEGYDLEDIIEMGEEGLQGIDYIGPTRAKAIYAAALEVFRD